MEKPRYFLAVFLAKSEKENGKIVDVGYDPCFDEPPSWGICRPTVRKYVKRGDVLIFVAKIGNSYILKGWFEVGEKIGYASALERFPDRHNVIVSREAPSVENTVFSYKESKKIDKNAIPLFLKRIVSGESIFYQNSKDDHAVDNWKCRRIFHCNKNAYSNCIKENKCFKEHSFDKMQNYVVANKWEDLDYLSLDFNDIKNEFGFNKNLKTPKGQHNIMRFDDYWNGFEAFISRKKVEFIGRAGGRKENTIF